MAGSVADEVAMSVSTTETWTHGVSNRHVKGNEATEIVKFLDDVDSYTPTVRAPNDSV
jgi:hypothetical protein